MQRSVIGMRIKRLIHQGFTLIELLIVLLIIGITLGFALLHFGDFGERQALIFAAQQFAHTLNLAKQQATLSSNTLGLVVDNNHYQLFQFKPPSQWISLSNTLFKRHGFPKDTRITLKTAYQNVKGGPMILITPLGEMTPFRISIGNKNNPLLRILQGNHQGELKWIQDQ